MMRSRPPYVTSTTSIADVVDLLIEKRYPMVIIVNPNELDGTTAYSSSSLRAVGVFTYDQLCQFFTTQSKLPKRSTINLTKYHQSL